MKKNKMMRVASGLMVAVLMTTSAISGTFAKYVTEASASDTARVAMFGVEISTTGSVFATSYANEGDIEKSAKDGTDISASVTSSGVTSLSSYTNVVAPGTVNPTGGLVFSVTGTPEVAVHIEFDVSGVKDVFMPAGSYPNLTGSGDANFTVGEGGYYPIVYTLTVVDSGSTKPATKVATGSLADIETYLEGLNTDLYYGPGTDLSTVFGTYTLTWEWPFDNTATVAYADKADTWLGQYAAGLTAKPDFATTLSQEAAATIKLTVTQVD